MADPNTRQGKRTPVTLKIKFKSETLEQFIERYAVDVSQGGIFIRTKEPLAVGTQMKFEFQLRDASPLIAGEGTVVWTRENDPSRPAIAPGMGVRFDRLADGSQTVLEKILSEKAKQAPRAQADQQKARNEAAAAFTDTPTRVAPAAVQSALGLRSRSDSVTPLPGPLPFHSDAEDFDEKAFEEATKVRSLEELAAQSAGLLGGDDTADDDAFGNKHQTAILPPDELAARRQASRDGGDPPLAEPPPERSGRSGTNPGLGMPKGVPDRDSAPSLPTPPAVEGARAPRMLDTTPSPQPIQRPSQPVIHEGSARTSLGVEPARAAVAAKASAAEPAAEPARPVAPDQGSKAPLVIVGLVVIAAAAAAVWWFGLRDKVAKDVADRGAGSATTTPDTGSNTPTPTNAGGSGSGSAGSAVVATGSADASGSAAGSGSAAVPATGSNTGSAAVATPTAPTVDTVVASLAKGATIEIVGTDQKGPAPLTAKLEKGKAYKARVSAPGYADQEIDVTGGEKASAKLELKPRVLSVTSDPPGADILIDGVSTKKQTPSDVTLTATQAAKARVRVTLRRAGYRATDQMVDASAFQDGGESMTHAITAKLAVQQQVVRPPTNTGGSGGGTGAGSGSATGDSGSGGDGAGSGTSGGDAGTTTPSGGGAGSGTTTPPSGGGTGTPTPPAGGAGTGSASKPSGGQPPATSLGGGTTLKPSEPEPTWTK